MDSLLQIAKQHNLIIIEDAAQGLGAKYKGDGIGTFDKGATISFYPAKNLGSFGDGGAFVTNDKKMYDKVKVLRDHGRNEEGVFVETMLIGAPDRFVEQGSRNEQLTSADLNPEQIFSRIFKKISSLNLT